jgi:nitrate reductase NapAB chaperone NapD
MAVASIIVEIEKNSMEQVLPALGNIPGISVFGVKDNQIVTVVEAETLGSVSEIIKKLSEFEKVTGVYPVYAGDYE